jgi:hypothetical protein
VADSRWTQVPGLTTSRGEPVFAAVRITDNCAMLNLNVAHCFYQDSYATDVSPFMTPWYTCVDDGSGSNYDLQIFHDNQDGSGRYLTEINYLPFLRGHDLNGDFLGGATTGDNWTNIMLARGITTVGTVTGFVGSHDVPALPDVSQNVFMNVESPISGFQFFDIGDELELRNRYLVTSKVEARFEQDIVANYTLDSGNGAGGAYAALEVPRDTTNDFGSWTRRIDPYNFDKWDETGAVPATPMPDPYEYDRRHVCTVYSYDRMFRRGDYALLDGEFATLTSAPVWTEQMKEQARKIFWPTGPVTTDIETSWINYTYDDTLPTILYPYAGPTNNVETRRKILHLLFAFREYFYDPPTVTKQDAALKAAQVVVNLIDYSDATGTNGPFTDAPASGLDYGTQLDEDCTFITIDIIDDMITEVSTVLGIPITFDFGLPAGEVVFGYERQPFISEVYAEWTENDPLNDLDDTLDAIAIELINPYYDPVATQNLIDLEGWKIQIGNSPEYVFPLNAINPWNVPGADSSGNSGRQVLHGSGPVSLAGGITPTDPIAELDNLQTLFFDSGRDISIKLLRPAPANSGVAFLMVDSVSDADMRTILKQTPDGAYSLQRDDDNWKFIHGLFETAIQPAAGYLLGDDNAAISSGLNAFQIGVADDSLPLCRWHELEVLGLYGNGPDTDPNISTVSSILAGLTPGTDLYHFDLTALTDNPLDYIATINRPDIGTLPGRININTAPVHVIAAAIPPMLADPNNGGGFSALDFARAIVDRRKNVGPYGKLSDLLSISPGLGGVDFQSYVNDPNTYYSAGQSSIEDDIEEEHWILSNLANKFTVRSDVFTAYILVRLGQEGPQRRMIAIFDRSQVWDKNDRPKLVALHPVPDPR